MAEFRVIELRGEIESVGPVEFLWADMPMVPSPFAVVHYALHGEEQRLGLRLDMDKRVFLDRPKQVEATIVQDRAYKITDYLAEHITR